MLKHNRRQDSARNRDEVRREDEILCQRLRQAGEHFRCVPVAQHAIRSQIFIHFAEMSFKLRALPPCEKTIVFYSLTPDALCSLAARIHDSDLQPATMELLSPYGETELPIDTKQFEGTSLAPSYPKP